MSQCGLLPPCEQFCVHAQSEMLIQRATANPKHRQALTRMQNNAWPGIVWRGISSMVLKEHYLAVCLELIPC